MIEVNEGLTRQVAELARLELTAEEIQAFTPQLKDILEYVSLLAGAPIQATAALGAETPLRDDIVHEWPKGENGVPVIIQHAPEIWDGGFRVPPIL